MNLRPLGYESGERRLRRLSASMQSKIRAAQGATASHTVSRRSPCPRRLYYTRYYTEGHQHHPADRDADAAHHVRQPAPRIQDQRTGRAITCQRPSQCPSVQPPRSPTLLTGSSRRAGCAEGNRSSGSSTSSPPRSCSNWCPPGTSATGPQHAVPSWRRPGCPGKSSTASTACTVTRWRWPWNRSAHQPDNPPDRNGPASDE